MINLFDNYTTESRDLHIAMLMSDHRQETVVINDDGYLPDDVVSPLMYFFKHAGAKFEGHPRYFNQIDLPRFWEIEASAQEGKIMDKGIQRGRITYNRTDNERQVKTVEWFDRQGKTRVIDRYNQWGWKFAITTLDEEGNYAITTYLTPDGFEVLVENHFTGDIIYNHNPQGDFSIFKNRTEMVKYYLEHADLTVDRIMYNTLADGFQVTESMASTTHDNILFWQEPITDSVPGNMAYLLSQEDANTKVVVQHREAYERLMTLLPADQQAKVTYLGFIYPFRRQNQQRPTAVTFTNSDQMEQLEALVKTLPQVTFNVGALTEMSTKLLNFDQYDNVNLYPQILQTDVDRLVQEADLYLDINHGNEILDASRTAFENNMLILGFDQTVHNRRFTAPEHIYQPEKVEDMITLVNTVLGDGNALEDQLQAQWHHAGEETVEHYNQVIG